MMNKIFSFFKIKQNDYPLENEDEENIFDQTKIECPILYRHHGYWACGKGWHQLLADLSHKIEELHERYYKKYHIRAEFQDIKEKWSELRIDYCLRVDPCMFVQILGETYSVIVRILEHIDFKMKSIVDHPHFIRHEEQELTKAEYLEKKKYAKNCSNVECFERDEKFYYVVDYDQYRQTHTAPTRLKLLHKLMTRCNRKAMAIHYSNVECSSKQQMIKSYMQQTIDLYVQSTIDKSYNTCEMCGQTIGNEYSPACETTGWIRRICETCAKENDTEYHMNGNLMHKGNILKTKAQIEYERSNSLKNNEREEMIDENQE